jgi:hypothetical protein
MYKFKYGDFKKKKAWNLPKSSKNIGYFFWEKIFQMWLFFGKIFLKFLLTMLLGTFFYKK